MKTRHRLFLLSALLPTLVYAQPNTGTSLYRLLKTASTDSAKYAIQDKLVDFYIETKRDSALYFANKCIALAQKNGKLLNEAYAYSNKGHTLMHLNRLTESYGCFGQAFDLANDPNNAGKTWDISAILHPEASRKRVLARLYLDFGNLIGVTGDSEKQLTVYLQGKAIAIQNKDSVNLALLYLSISHKYIDRGQLDEALPMLQYTIRVISHAGINPPLGYAKMLIGLIYQKKKQDNLALRYFRQSIRLSTRFQNYTNLNGSYNLITSFYLSEKKNTDSAIHYARKNLALLKVTNSSDFSRVYTQLASGFKLLGNRDSVLKYQSLALIAKDSAYNQRTIALNNLQKIALEEAEKKRQHEKIENDAKSKRQILIAATVLAVAFAVSLTLYQSNRRKQKANASLQKALTELKKTQSQLVQAEKMASLGELTAGIAHEIQNPLNFVNNFSEVSTELVSELKDELDRGDTIEAKAIADDLTQNLQKITLHGGRASAIVKGMLEHSRASTGQRQATDLDALAEEYLRLAYQAVRAKDKSFNADLKTDFAADLGKIDVVPQDIGRVLLNLYNNAFYAVQQKQKTASSDYQPTVTVSTRLLASNRPERTTSITRPNGLGTTGTEETAKGIIEIRVSDNGTGIPEAVKTKIFQPFFTTKPTGEGTGLGLSLSYDIITKGHGGTLTVESVAGEGTTFIIGLPQKAST